MADNDAIDIDIVDVADLAVAGESVDQVGAVAMVTRVRGALVDVLWNEGWDEKNS